MYKVLGTIIVGLLACAAYGLADRNPLSFFVCFGIGGTCFQMANRAWARRQSYFAIVGYAVLAWLLCAACMFFPIAMMAFFVLYALGLACLSLIKERIV